MLKASALYIVIVIALVIGIICASLVAVAFYYKLDYQKKSRYDQLERNIGSGINILLASTDTSWSAGKTTSLFNNGSDSVFLKRSIWGVYDVCVVKSFSQSDTLYKTFTIANSIDSSKWAALYLIDEDRSFSLSGKTIIRGDAYIPKAGVQEAFVDNKGYIGDKRLIIGTRHFSEKVLPLLDEIRIRQLSVYCSNQRAGEIALLEKDSVEASFLKPTQFVSFKKQVKTIKNIYLSGNIVLFSDTTLIIDSTAVLKNILVFAQGIVVKRGFHGNCQLFAKDSISVGNSCRFEYPSCLGALRYQTDVVSAQEKIVIGDSTVFNGLAFTYEKANNTLKPVLQIGKNTRFIGQLFSQGIMRLRDSVIINGSVFTSRFHYKTAFTLYENYLVDLTLDSKALSPYYLTSELVPVASKKKKILQWLEKN